MEPFSLRDVIGVFYQSFKNNGGDDWGWMLLNEQIGSKVHIALMLSSVSTVGADMGTHPMWLKWYLHEY